MPLTRSGITKHENGSYTKPGVRRGKQGVFIMKRFINFMWSYKCTKNDVQQPIKYTHLSLDGYAGGKFCVPEKMLPRLFQYYGESIDRGSSLYMIERKTETFPMFFDVDWNLVDDRLVFNDRRKQCMSLVLSKVVHEFFPSKKNMLMVVCSSTPQSEHASSLDGIENRKKKKHDDENNLVDLIHLFSADNESNKKTMKKDSHSKLNEGFGDEKLSVLKEAFNDDDFIINDSLSVSEKPTSSNLHIHFPDLIVNEEMAVIIAETVRHKLQSVVGSLPFMKNKTWATVIDSSPYSAHGSLRMVGSRKCKKCPECFKRCVNNEISRTHGNRNKRKETCNVCFGEKYVDLGKVYKPKWLFKGSSMYIDDRITNWAYATMICSVRNWKELSMTQGFSCIGDIPRLKITKLKQPQEDDDFHTLQQKRNYNMEVVRNAGRVPKKRGFARVDRKCREWDVCLELIKNFHPMWYKNSYISNLYMNLHGTVYICYIDGEGSTSCRNLTSKKKSHNSAKVYFQVTHKGIVQKCTCKCKTTEGREFGMPCSRFKSDIRPLSLPQKICLFPEMFSHKNVNPFLLYNLGANNHKKDAISKSFDQHLLTSHGSSQLKTGMRKTNKKRKNTTQSNKSNIKVTRVLHELTKIGKKKIIDGVLQDSMENKCGLLSRKHMMMSR
jgi:hypothetical protein